MFNRKNRRNRAKSSWKQAVGQAIRCVSEPLEGRVLLAATPTLFVVNNGSANVGTYDATTGAVINASLLSGFSSPYGIAVSGSNVYVTDASNGTVGEYTTSGTTINANLVTGLGSPQGIVVSGGDLFVVDEGNSVVGEYDATTGAVVNANLLTGFTDPYGIAVSGSDLFVTDEGNGTIGEYTTAGATVNASLVTGLQSPDGIVVTLGSLLGGDIYVTDETAGTVGDYNSVTGATINASLISGFSDPYGIAISGSDLYVTDQTNGTIGEYTTAGTTVNASLVSGLSGPTGIAEADVTVGAPVITLNPNNQSVASGNTATFTAAATGTPTPTVQWQVSTDGGVTWNDIRHAKHTTYSFTANTGENGYEYQAVFTNTQGSATTTAATLTVTGPPQPITVSGTVYNDRNGDGVKEHKEPGIANVAVYLAQANRHGKPTGPIQRMRSDAQGNYSFTNLAAGRYAVWEKTPKGDSITQPSGGQYTIILSTGQQLTGENFGLTPTMAPLGNFSLDTAQFTQAMIGPLPQPPLNDPKAVTDFFGNGSLVIGSGNVTLNITITSNDGTQAGSNSASLSFTNPMTLTRVNKRLSEFTGVGAATVNIDGSVFNFTLDVSGGVYISPKQSYANGQFFAVDANGKVLQQGPQAIFDGKFSM